MQEEAYFPFLVNKNIVNFTLKTIYKLNRLDDSSNYFSTVEKLHEISRALTILAEQELNFFSKRYQRKFDLISSILNLNILTYNAKKLAQMFLLTYEKNPVCDKQIKNVSYINEGDTFSFKITLYDSSKENIPLSTLLDLLDYNMNILSQILRLLEKKWYQIIKDNDMIDKLSFSDYIHFIKIKSYKNSHRHFEMFNHFLVMNELKYVDSINKNALTKYLNALKLFLDEFYMNPTHENYQKLLYLANLKLTSDIEKEDIKILKTLICGKSNTYYQENANYIFKENRQFIFERLYWEDDINNYGKYGLYFLSLYYLNLQFDSPLQEIIPNNDMYRI